MARYKECWNTMERTPNWAITLSQAGPNKFKVQYGKQISAPLSYGAAATELGCCIMHALACEGNIDNS